MIQINKELGQNILELGGGDNPHPASDVRVDIRAGKYTNFTADFEKPLPIADKGFDGVICQYALEHIRFFNVPVFLREIYRVLKPGKKVIIATANTEAQFKWIQSHPDGWDNKELFHAASELIFGSLDYPENSHKAFFTPAILMRLFQDAGFENIVTQPYNERDTDIVVTASRPMVDAEQPKLIGVEPVIPQTPSIQSVPREQLFDKLYFGGGGKFGGYAGTGYADFPCHELTFQHVMARKPESVLEIGCARGYVLKRFQDAGIKAHGIEISEHCYLTRVCEHITQWDTCKTPWLLEGIDRFDLCFSAAFLEHIPEEYLPSVIGEMKRLCKRGLHGIDFGERDDGFDRTHCTLKSKDWWVAKFKEHAPGWSVEIVNKEELEKGDYPPSLFKGDGKAKLNIGSFTTMNHHGWVNLDLHDLNQFAQQFQYHFLRCDVKNGIPVQTESIDYIFSSHMLEHLTYEEGLKFLRDCRRIIKPSGAMRFIVPDADFLINAYDNHNLDQFNEMNDGCAKAKTSAGKLWALLHEGHASCYDAETLLDALEQTGFTPTLGVFRECIKPCQQILRETTEMTYGGISLFVDAVPKIG